MHSFKLTDLQALSDRPEKDVAAWLAGAEHSIAYLKGNAQNDEIVIYVSGNSVLWTV